jgi:transcription termination/antitermination protein NusA
MSAGASNEDHLLRQLRTQVPDIASGRVQIRGFAREPGRACLVCVDSSGSVSDPIGSCLGAVRSVVRSLESDERLTFVRWSDSPEELIRGVVAPARVKQVTLDHQTRRAQMVCGAKDASRLTSDGGLTLRLASELTGWDLELART